MEALSVTVSFLLGQTEVPYDSNGLNKIVQLNIPPKLVINYRHILCFDYSSLSQRSVETSAFIAFRFLSGANELS